MRNSPIGPIGTCSGSHPLACSLCVCVLCTSRSPFFSQLKPNNNRTSSKIRETVTPPPPPSPNHTESSVDTDMAKANANKAPDPETRKLLWLKIAKREVERCRSTDIEGTMRVLQVIGFRSPYRFFFNRESARGSSPSLGVGGG